MTSPLSADSAVPIATRILSALYRGILGPRASDWRARQARFENLTPHVEAMWTRVEGGLPRWSFHPVTDKGTTRRDVLLFQAEATVAGRMLLRFPGHRLRLVRLRSWWRGESHVDRWMNAALSLVGEETRLIIGGSEEGLPVEGELVNRVPDLSAVACAQLAAGQKPTDYRNLRR